MLLDSNGIIKIILENDDLEKLDMKEYRTLKNELQANDLSLGECVRIIANNGIIDINNTLPDALTQGEKETVTAFFYFCDTFYEKYNMILYANEINHQGNVQIWLNFNDVFGLTDDAQRLNSVVPIDVCANNIFK